MFTGLVRELGTVARLERSKGLVRLTIDGPKTASQLERLDSLTDMLDEEHLQQLLRIQEKGQIVPDKAAVFGTISNTLQAVAELKRKKPDLDLSVLYPAIDKLEQSSMYHLDAKKALIALGRK